jgi:hypothetical protein
MIVLLVCLQDDNMNTNERERGHQELRHSEKSTHNSPTNDMGVELGTVDRKIMNISNDWKYSSMPTFL